MIRHKVLVVAVAILCCIALNLKAEQSPTEGDSDFVEVSRISSEESQSKPGEAQTAQSQEDEQEGPVSDNTPIDQATTGASPGEKEASDADNPDTITESVRSSLSSVLKDIETATEDDDGDALIRINGVSEQPAKQPAVSGQDTTEQPTHVQDVKLYVKKGYRNESCTETCNRYSLVCRVKAFHVLNNCETLNRAFRCSTTCLSGFDATTPALVSFSSGFHVCFKHLDASKANWLAFPFFASPV